MEDRYSFGRRNGSWQLVQPFLPSSPMAVLNAASSLVAATALARSIALGKPARNFALSFQMSGLAHVSLAPFSLPTGNMPLALARGGGNRLRVWFHGACREHRVLDVF
jgi:hypothetical protein